MRKKTADERTPDSAAPEEQPGETGAEGRDQQRHQGQTALRPGGRRLPRRRHRPTLKRVTHDPTTFLTARAWELTLGRGTHPLVSSGGAPAPWRAVARFSGRLSGQSEVVSELRS